MPKTTFHLIRHGETHWNVLKKMQGHGGSGLNEKGRSQVQVMAASLRDRTFAALYTSDSQRTLESAAIIAEVIGLPPIPDPRLRERDQGDWTGMTLVEAETLYPELYRKVNDDMAYTAPPNGETLQQVTDRMTAVLDAIAAAHLNEQVLIVSHGLAIGSVRAFSAGKGLGEAFHMRTQNAEIITIDWPPG